MQPADRESELCVALPADAGAVLRRGAAIFAREVEARGGGRVRLGGPAPAALELALEPGIGPDGFRIAGGPGGRIRVAGNNERGAVYGIGKLLRSGRVESGRFRPGPWRGTSVPAKPVRGLYLATHFHNFYHDAPLGEVEAYIEELALWGFNTLMVWYDMHHFKGFDDPEAVAFRERLARLAGAARGVGMKFGFTIIANEAYADSPPELRADPRAKRGGYYDVAVCPSRPGGLAYIKRVFSQFFEWASDLRPEYLWIWPFDQGSCGCPACSPWACNGFLKCARLEADLARAAWPGVSVVLSTWMFREWEAFRAAFPEPPAWVDLLLAEPPRAGIVPGAVPVVGFPEISMWGMNPWGGYGATPLPERHERLWREAAPLCEGGFPYSEGRFEDINKVLYGGFYWEPARPAADILAEYVGYEFSPAVVAEVCGAVRILERNHRQPDPDLAQEADALLGRAEARLSDAARSSWRWRILRIRARIDRIGRTAQDPALAEALQELVGLYYAQNALEGVVKPPVPVRR